MADDSTAGGPEFPTRSERAGPRLRRAVPYASGAVVALLAVLLYGALVPGRPALSQQDLDDTVANALASVTPPPAYSAVVYQAVLPSLVLIETERPANAGRPEESDGLGSGVVVTVDGDILTSLHVVADATAIKLTFSNGTQASGEIVARQPENDIAVVRATEP